MALSLHTVWCHLKRAQFEGMPIFLQIASNTDLSTRRSQLRTFRGECATASCVARAHVRAGVAAVIMGMSQVI